LVFFSIDARATCPDITLGETIADCPWSETARNLIAASDSSTLENIFNAAVPEIRNQIERDRAIPGLLGFWGLSINYDEFVQGTILDPRILDLLLSLEGASAREDRITHAGVEHTYGYLFSVLKTAFGYKRARWVQGEIDAGFGFTQPTISPTPQEGTLLTNATTVFGKIFWRDRPEVLRRIAPLTQKHSDIKQFYVSSLKIDRLVEKTSAATLITDIVAFQFPSGGTNTHLLVYGWENPETGERKLITAFPVALSFIQQVFDPSNLGERRPIISRYNAFIPGLTAVSGSQTPVLGSRTRESTP
jgi:hypothetical protein